MKENSNLDFLKDDNKVESESPGALLNLNHESGTPYGNPNHEPPNVCEELRFEELRRIRILLEKLEEATSKRKPKRNLENSPKFEIYEEVSEMLEPDEDVFNTSSDLINAIKTEYGDEEYLKPVIFGKILTHYFSEYKTARIIGGVSKRGYKIKLK